MDVNVNINLPEPLNELLNPVARQVGHTFSLAWEAGPGVLNTWCEKIIYKRQLSFQSFKKEIKEAMSNIPPGDLQEPSISLLGPALEATSYYIEEETIRQMFASLIAASMDKRKNGQVHHSFVDVIKQMTPLDAKVLSKLDNPTILLHYQTHDRNNPPNKVGITSDILLSDDFPEFDNDVSLSIGNLARLGFLEIPTRNMGSVRIGGNNPEILDRFQRTQLYADLESNLHSTSSSLENYEVVSYPSYLTKFAFTFRDICLSTSIAAS